MLALSNTKQAKSSDQPIRKWLLFRPYGVWNILAMTAQVYSLRWFIENDYASVVINVVAGATDVLDNRCVAAGYNLASRFEHPWMPRCAPMHL